MKISLDRIETVSVHDQNEKYNITSSDAEFARAHEAAFGRAPEAAFGRAPEVAFGRAPEA